MIMAVKSITGAMAGQQLWPQRHDPQGAFLAACTGTKQCSMYMTYPYRGFRHHISLSAAIYKKVIMHGAVSVSGYAVVLICALLLASRAVPIVANQVPSDCKEQWYTQRLDHFRWARQIDQPTFQQRYIVCDAHWANKGPIFFYAGNEGPLEGYVKSAGLMFENRGQHGALVLFAEVSITL